MVEPQLLTVGKEISPGCYVKKLWVCTEITYKDHTIPIAISDTDLHFHGISVYEALRLKIYIDPSAQITLSTLFSDLQEHHDLSYKQKKRIAAFIGFVMQYHDETQKGLPSWFSNSRNALYSLLLQFTEDTLGISFFWEMRGKNEFFLHEWVEENICSIIGEGDIFIKKEYSIGKKRVDLLIEKNGMQILIECKTGKIGQRSLKQIKNYMKMSGINKGILVGSHCVVKLPSNVTFFPHNDEYKKEKENKYELKENENYQEGLDNWLDEQDMLDLNNEE